ncbi:MAG: hypothetical protein RLZZ628_1621 [Bacteroidota bacterium]|jgi:hypothetical integral membrane protein (TIGR02206 family)
MFIEVLGFKPFGAEHGIILLVISFVLISSCMVGRRLPNPQAHLLGIFIAGIACALQLAWTIHRIVKGTFTVQEDVPFQICNLCALAAPYVLWLLQKGKSQPFEILYFWVMTGALQALLTPTLEYVFPAFGYFQFWGLHAGLVIAVLYGVLVLKQRPNWASLKAAFLWLQVWAGATWTFNWWTNSNYGFLMHKPAGHSLFDFFGNHYILVAQLVCLIFFSVAWLPFRQKQS